MGGAASGWGVRDIRQRCRDYRELLAESPDLCTPEELSAYWPGGSENRIASPGCWIYCFGIYLGFLNRMKGAPGAEDRDAAAHAAAIAAFREVPATVVLDPAGDDTTRTATCYPKSYDAIAFVDELHGDVCWLLDQIPRLEQRWSAEDQLKRREAFRMITELQLLQCWIATSVGPALPFDPGEPFPEIPEGARSWTPMDILRILAGYREVNRRRIDLMSGALRPSGGGEPVSFATLGVAAAKATGSGSAEHLFQRRSLGGWLGQFIIERQAADEAAAQAEAAARAERTTMPEMVG